MYIQISKNNMFISFLNNYILILYLYIILMELLEDIVFQEHIENDQFLKLLKQFNENREGGKSLKKFDNIYIDSIKNNKITLHKKQNEINKIQNEIEEIDKQLRDLPKKRGRPKNERIDEELPYNYQCFYRGKIRMFKNGKEMADYLGIHPLSVWRVCSGQYKRNPYQIKKII